MSEMGKSPLLQNVGTRMKASPQRGKKSCRSPFVAFCFRKSIGSLARVFPTSSKTQGRSNPHLHEHYFRDSLGSPKRQAAAKKHETVCGARALVEKLARLARLATLPTAPLPATSHTRSQLHAAFQGCGHNCIVHSPPRFACHEIILPTSQLSIPSHRPTCILSLPQKGATIIKSVEKANCAQHPRSCQPPPSDWCRALARTALIAIDPLKAKVWSSVGSVESVIEVGKDCRGRDARVG